MFLWIFRLSFWHNSKQSILAVFLYSVKLFPLFPVFPLFSPFYLSLYSLCSLLFPISIWSLHSTMVLSIYLHWWCQTVERSLFLEISSKPFEIVTYHSERFIQFILLEFSIFHFWSEYIMRKVWYHQIWIQNYLGFIVSDLIFMFQYSNIFIHLYKCIIVIHVK